jgi:hypothetical protein
VKPLTRVAVPEHEIHARCHRFKIFQQGSAVFARFDVLTDKHARAGTNTGPERRPKRTTRTGCALRPADSRRIWFSISRLEETTMRNKLMSLMFALAAVPAAGAYAAPGTCSVNLTQDPLVMRIGKDEFRIAFGLDAAACKDSGCSGSISYDTTWETEDGQRSTERKTVAFNIPDGAERSLSVDRSYFDTAEAQHTTKVVKVDVSQIRCDSGAQTGLASR